MPRRTAADKARSSAKYWKKRIDEAYTTENRSAPLAEAVRWLYAALSQRANENPENAAEMYKHATDQISGFAAQIQNLIIADAEKEK